MTLKIILSHVCMLSIKQVVVHIRCKCTYICTCTKLYTQIVDDTTDKGLFSITIGHNGPDEDTYIFNYLNNPDNNNNNINSDNHNNKNNNLILKNNTNIRDKVNYFVVKTTTLTKSHGTCGQFFSTECTNGLKTVDKILNRIISNCNNSNNNKNTNHNNINSNSNNLNSNNVTINKKNKSKNLDDSTSKFTCRNIENDDDVINSTTNKNISNVISNSNNNKQINNDKNIKKSTDNKSINTSFKNDSKKQLQNNSNHHRFDSERHINLVELDKISNLKIDRSRLDNYMIKSMHSASSKRRKSLRQKK
ncbi:hypothetical protein HELRODRAFT_165908 [Helobdella robusta]|uniref:Uncharacterized protein n=1 Tax=Helobdella robusta TaxID=6412 RepID=T1EXF7_HELRO|nr:hypothetical protein HELRODRAFT_165908 [Helobdella robusta]ESN91826.1 hypothetical protein HELRODRAFT_165908 [Helobdella robusta]